MFTGSSLFRLGGGGFAFLRVSAGARRLLTYAGVARLSLFETVVAELVFPTKVLRTRHSST